MVNAGVAHCPMAAGAPSRVGVGAAVLLTVGSRGGVIGHKVVGAQRKPSGAKDVEQLPGHR